jgi:hypothetical protein
MFAARIAPGRSVFSWKQDSEVARSSLPGMDETATFGGSVILLTHG